jgi:hypothetical protein
MLRNSSCHVQVPGHFMTRLRYFCQVARPPLRGRTRRKSPCSLPVAIFSVRRMDVRFEQRVNIKFCVKLGKTATCWLTPCISISRPATKFCGRTWRHENIEAIQAVATMELTGIPKEAFTSCIQDLQKRWQQCIDCGGNYFEGDRKH